MKNLRISLLGVVAAATLGLSAGGAQADITVATAGPMTGAYAAFGEQMRRGAEMAVKDLNAKGGVLGEKLRLEVGDDACDPKQAVAVANQMVNADIALMAGHFCSGSSIPASNVYHEEGILQISPASTNPTLTERGYDNVFRMCGRDDQQGKIAGQYLYDHYKDAKIAIVHDKQAYSKGLADATKAALNKLGVKEAMYETVNPNEKDYSALVTKMKGAGIDVLYYGGYHTEAGLITRQMRQQGMDTQMISGDALLTEEYWAITGEAGEGTLMTFSPDPRKNAAAQEVVAEFREGGYEPEGYTLYTYATIQAWAQAAEKAGSTDLDKILEVLHNTTFKTVLGDISFDEKGDVEQPTYVWYIWKNGEYAQM